MDQKNKVLGENKLIEFGNDKALVYSFIVAVDFQGKPANVYGVLNSDEIHFQKELILSISSTNKKLWEVLLLR